MESERTPNIDPREHLRAFNSAAQTSEAEAHVPAPLWFWPSIAFLAPAAVALQRLDGLPRVAAIAAMLVPVLISMYVVTRRERRAGARVSAGVRHARMFMWRFLTLFCFILSLQMTSLLSWSSGIAVAVFTYLVIAIGSTFFAHKGDQHMIALVSAPVHA